MREMRLLIRQGCNTEDCGANFQREYPWQVPIGESQAHFDKAMGLRGWQRIDHEQARCPDHREEE